MIFLVRSFWLFSFFPNIRILGSFPVPPLKIPKLILVLRVITGKCVVLRCKVWRTNLFTVVDLLTMPNFIELRQRLLNLKRGENWKRAIKRKKKIFFFLNQMTPTSQMIDFAPSNKSIMASRQLKKGKFVKWGERGKEPWFYEDCCISFGSFPLSLHIRISIWKNNFTLP